MLKLLARSWKMLRQFRWMFATVFSYLFILQIMGLVAPVIYGKVIDSVLRNDIGGALLLATLGFAVDVLGNFLGYQKFAFEIRNLDYDFPRKMTRTTLSKYLDFSFGQHVNTHSGIKMSIMDEGRSAFGQSFDILMYNIIPIMGTFLFVCAYLFYKSPALGVVVAGGGSFFLYSIYRLNKAIMDDVKKERDEWHKLNKEQTEIVRNAGIIGLNSQEEKSVDRYDRAYGSYSEFGKSLWLRFIRTNALFNYSIPDLTSYVVLAVGLYFVSVGSYTPGFLVTVMALSSRAIGQLGMMGHMQRLLLANRVKIEKYFTMMDVESDVKVVENPIRPEKFEGRIEFRNVSFAYKVRSYVKDDKEIEEDIKDKPVLKNVSFFINPGEKVAIVGKNASGKSTLGRLILRAADPDNGQILVDGHDLRLLDLKRYREHGAAYVEQDVYLFDRTLRDNILFGLNGRSSTITDEEIRKVLKISRIESFFHDLGHGLDTLIGEKGVKLSGGQVKMVGIARAVIKNPSILLFDEATAGLDQEEEALMYDAMQEVSSGRTTLVITHRLSTIRNMDRILVFNAGELVGEGKHVDLIHNCPTYKSLTQSSVATF